MKKIKLISLVAILLTAVMLLASCGASSIGNLLDKEAAYIDPFPAYTQTAAVAALTDMVNGESAGDLKLFTKYDGITTLTKYAVYDVANDKVVWQAEETNNETPTSRSKTLYAVNLEKLNEGVYFTVTTTNIVVTLEEGVEIKTDETKSVAIWAWNGTDYAELVKVDKPRGVVEDAQDLIYFEGKIYREDAETKAVAYAFDYSVLANFPSLDYTTEDYYVAQDGDLFVTYDKELNKLSAFTLPSYADGLCIVLGNKLFAQYLVEEDMFGDKYDILFDIDEKASMHTVLVDLKSAKVEKIENDYLLVDDDYITSDDEYWTREYGFKADKKGALALVLVTKVENKRVDESDMAYQWATINEKGDITILKFPTALPVEHFAMTAQGVWVLQTVDGMTYLINEKGDIIGEVDYTKAEESTLNYFAANGKLYDFSLNEIYDYQADKLTILRSTPKAMMFANEDNELIIYANGQKTTLINKDSLLTREYSELYSDLYDGYFVIVDTSDAANTKYEIYNVEGKLIKTVDQTTSFAITTVAQAKDNAVKLVKITTWATGATQATVSYYRFS